MNWVGLMASLRCSTVILLIAGSIGAQSPQDKGKKQEQKIERPKEPPKQEPVPERIERKKERQQERNKELDRRLNTPKR